MFIEKGDLFNVLFEPVSEEIHGRNIELLDVEGLKNIG